MAKAKSGVPAGLHTVTPHLIMNDTSSALAWYEKALGAETLSKAPGPDGKIMHAEMRIGNSHVYLNDEMGGGRSLKALGGSPVSLWIYVDDCDALFNRAVAAGAKVAPGPMGALTDQFWGDRTGTLSDPYGLKWTVATHVRDVSPKEMEEAMKKMAKAA